MTAERILREFIATCAAPRSAVDTGVFALYEGLRVHRYETVRKGWENARGAVQRLGKDFSGLAQARPSRHLPQCFGELTVCPYQRDQDTCDRIDAIAGGLLGERLRYPDLGGGTQAP